MDIYHIWCNLKEGVSDTSFSNAVTSYLDDLVTREKLTRWRLTRRKLGLGYPGLGDFHLMLEFENLAQLDEAFGTVATRSEPVESLHHAVNSLVSDVKFALYRDFPDEVRQRGEEKF